MTLYSELKLALQQGCPHSQIFLDEPMSRHTSFRIGGPAPLLIIPGTADELPRALSILNKAGTPPLVIGNGSNLLVEDVPLPFPVIQTHSGFEIPELLEGNRLRAPSGITLAKLAMFALNSGLTGLEFAHGIPGSLGGAVFMNAGAYGGEMIQVVDETTAIQNEKFVIIKGKEHDFGYRHSTFSENGGVILSSVLQLQPGNSEVIRTRMEELAAKRRASQPLEFPSAGSTFKRPVGAYAAALIDKCGLKGFSVGGARVSEKHAGFVINGGNASFNDVIAVIEHVHNRVLQETGFNLEPEVRIIHACSEV